MLLYIPKNDMKLLTNFLDEKLKKNHDSKIAKIFLHLKKSFKDEDFTKLELSYGDLTHILDYYEDNFDMETDKETRPTYYKLMNTWAEGAFK